ncbi:MAG: glycosyl hydrolase 115 family protein [Asticcacaulis sp.]|uniref:glycosyl hydrolase 115 family protein n=1 Tax=Asticcacaulis sp. TaxID=1872648 RepID=UPI003F7B7ACC
MRGYCIGILLVFVATPAFAACEGPVAVCDGAGPGVALIHDSRPVAVYVDAEAEKPVARVASDFAADLGRVSGTDAQIVHSLDGVTGDVVVIGEMGHSSLIDAWVKAGKLNVSPIQGQWEAYAQQVIDLSNGHHALVITGADKRGAIYGTYDISAKMGVSPWYWWADVPTQHKDNLYVTAGLRHDQPVVKYRGFFINDEEPSFGGWAREKFGGINHELYAKVFELDLRLKGNYLWPAMWGKAIADDDPQSLDTADDYGIVLGTSHHEPMTRAQEEWHRHQDQGVTGGAWDYTKNADNLNTFWRGGIERMVACSSSDSGSTTKKCGHEDVVTIGMRGDGDEPMTEGGAIPLLESIVTDQRQIIADVTGKPASETPQVWALYKEVQDYYDHGMKVPDDVTLLFSDDNWGQIRRLPTFGAPPRTGGYGIYYHFDYVGGPRNYKWINTNQIEKTWQQMELADEAGADRLWIVNVGDIKPMEYPLSFFLDMAWNPKAMTPQALADYPTKWAGQQFGAEHAAEIGGILTRYTQYNARRKPELLNTGVAGDPDFADMTRAYNLLSLVVDSEGERLPAPLHDAFFQLVQYPVEASANLYELYAEANYSHVAGDAICGNKAADLAEAAFNEDAKLSGQYNALGDGKWDHMMDQTHIGYTNWQEPKTNIMPAVERKSAGSLPKNHVCSDFFQFAVCSLPPPPKPGNRFADYGGADGQDGYIAIEAPHFTRKTEAHGVRWQVIPDLGRTLGAVLSLPQSAPATHDGSMRLDYDVKTAKEADATLNLYLAPTLDTQGQGGLRIGVSIDDAPMQTLNFDLRPDTPQWNKAVEDNIIVLKAKFAKLNAGNHTIHIYRIDGNVVLERLVLDTGGLKPSYLGPPETAR